MQLCTVTFSAPTRFENNHPAYVGNVKLATNVHAHLDRFYLND